MRGDMFVTHLRIVLAVTIMLAAGCGVVPATAAEEFPFGLEMTLDVSPQPGSKRIPNLEIGDRGEVRLELWCKGGVGQFSVAGNTVIFVPGAMENRTCSPAQVEMDDALLAELAEAATWSRKGDHVSFIGRTTLRFHLNTN
jgi:hypothetical protein